MPGRGPCTPRQHLHNRASAGRPTTAHHRVDVIPGAASWMMGFMGKGLSGGRPAPKPAGAGGFMTQRSGGSPGSPAGKLFVLYFKKGCRSAISQHRNGVPCAIKAMSGQATKARGSAWSARVWPRS